MVDADAFEDILNPVVELGQKGSRGRLLSDGGIAVGDVCLKREQLLHHRFQCLQLDDHVLTEVGRGHKSTLPLRSISRVSREGGVKGTRSSGTCSSSSRRAPSAYNCQPATPSQARSRSRAWSGRRSALPKRIRRVAPYVLARAIAWSRCFCSIAILHQGQEASSEEALWPVGDILSRAYESSAKQGRVLTSLYHDVMQSKTASRTN